MMAGRSATRTWMRGVGKTPWLVIISTEKDVPCANYSLLLIRSCGKEEGATLPWRGNHWLVGRWGVSEGTSLLNSERPPNTYLSSANHQATIDQGHVDAIMPLTTSSPVFPEIRDSGSWLRPNIPDCGDNWSMLRRKFVAVHWCHR